jgi:hypothetical protein
MDVTRKWRVGQFPPLLYRDELKKAVEMLEGADRSEETLIAGSRGTI